MTSCLSIRNTGVKLKLSPEPKQRTVVHGSESSVFINVAQMETKPPSVKRYICSFPECSAAYNKKWKLDAHLCKHTGLKPYACEHDGCGKSFCSTSHLARHGLSHSGHRPFPCGVDGCSEAFTTNSNRNRHVSRVHTQETKAYTCKFEGCGLEFKKNKQLKSHVCEQHTQLPPYQCTYEGCHMRFTFPSKLKRHEKVHRGYPCQEADCPLIAKTWTELLKHRREQHKRALKCNQCNKVLKDSWSLYQHQAVHSDLRVIFKCPRDRCDRSFTTTFNLQSHIQSFHENLRPFSCTHPGCSKSFAMKQSLQRHCVVHDPQRRKQKVQRPKRSLASRLSGCREAEMCKNQRGRSSAQTDPGGPVELVSLLQDTSLLCSPAVVDTHGLSNVLTTPLTV